MGEPRRNGLKLDGLSDRTTMREVRQTLGEPTEVCSHAADNGETCQEWVYSAPGAWPAVCIRFDPDGTYASHDCDY